MTEKKLYVHGSKFHLDDALCAAMGKIMGYTYERTDDPNICNVAGPEDIVADFGRKYDGVRFFDHHQFDVPVPQDIGLNTRFPFSKVAAAGLLWAAKGADVIRAIDPTVQGSNIQEILDTIDIQIIAPSDHIDTGSGDVPPGICTLSYFVSAFAPDDQDPASFHQRFHQLVDNSITPFLESAIRKVIFKISSREYISAAPIVDGKIIVFEKYVPWVSEVQHTERFNNCLFCVFPSLRGGWSAQCIPIEKSYKTRKSFPETWGGQSGKHFAEMVGERFEPGDNFFCHNACFLIAAPTKEQVISMCNKAINA